MQTRASKEFNVNAICVDVGLSCGEAAQVPGCMKRRREEEKKRRREEEKKRRREEEKKRRREEEKKTSSGALLVFFRGWASWFFGGLQKVTRKHFENMSTSSTLMLLWLRCPFGVFSWLGFMVFSRLSKSNQKTF
jgi:hypothetical protein